MRAALRLAALAATLAPGAAGALTPVLACDGTIESGMRLADPGPLGDGPSGIVVEEYMNAMVPGTGAVLPAPVPDLRVFNGVRVTACATGEFVAFGANSASEVRAALGATEFLRPALQAGEAVAFADVRQAAEAVYGPVLVLRETEQTCACSVWFPELRPAGQTPFADRTNVD